MPDLIKRETLVAAAFVLLIAAIVILFYRLMSPFFAPLAWGAILAVTLHPVHVRLRARFRRAGSAAILMTIFVALVILAPMGYLAAALVGEASHLYERIQQSLNEQSFDWAGIRNHPFVRGLEERLGAFVDLSKLDIEGKIAGLLSTVSGYIVSHATSFIANVGRALLQFLLILLSTYYLFKDGDRLMSAVSGVIPLPKDRSARMLAHVTDVVRATIYGGLAVAALQGALGGLLFWILGIPSAVFWGALMGFLALIPVLGAFVVYLPAAIILALSGSVVKAIVLLAFGLGVVSQIDNLLKPLLISGRTQMHPLLLFFSIMGGLQAFGILGLVLGPVVAAVFVGVFDLYREMLLSASQDKSAAPAP